MRPPLALGNHLAVCHHRLVLKKEKTESANSLSVVQY